MQPLAVGRCFQIEALRTQYYDLYLEALADIPFLCFHDPQPTCVTICLVGHDNFAVARNLMVELCPDTCSSRVLVYPLKRKCWTVGILRAPTSTLR